jgi:L-threonylcarbamoyladenylate synthase
MSNSQFFSNCAADSIRHAAAAIKAGHLVAFPTETVYGLGADARNPEAVKRIYEVKGRPTDHPLIVHISSIRQLDKWAIDVPEYAIKLARKFWPGPLTLILNRSQIVGDFITGGQNTVGLRVPSDPIAMALISEFEKISNSAIAAPSANRFGQVSPTSSADVLDELGEYLSEHDSVLDGGNSLIGIESTIIDCTGLEPVILRLGKVTKLEIQELIGKVSLQSGQSKTKFSGEFEKHYAPKANVILDKVPSKGDCYMAMVQIPTPEGVNRVCSPNSVEDFAKNLYSTLRKVDALGVKNLIVIQPEGQGLAEAIRERLLKASKGR